MVATFLILDSKAEHKVTSSDKQKINALIVSNDCSDKALGSLKNKLPNPQDLDASIALIGYRATCYQKRQQYPEALTEYRQLASYYSKKHDAYRLAITDDTIKSIEDSIAHKVPRVQAKPDADAETQKGLKRP